MKDAGALRRRRAAGEFGGLKCGGSWRTTFVWLALNVIRCDDPLAKRKAYKFDVGRDAEFGADEIAGIGRGFDADMQRLSNVIHGFLRQQHAQDFEFPWAQRVDGRRFVGEPVHGEFVVDVGAERDAPSHDLGDRVQQRVWRVAFRDKAACAALIAWTA